MGDLRMEILQLMHLLSNDRETGFHTAENISDASGGKAGFDIQT
jgi:hypothetical protein